MAIRQASVPGCRSSVRYDRSQHAMTVRSTHVLEMAADQVIKRFRSWDRGEHQREWHALNVLAEFAPGLAPVPLGANLDADPPTIVMTRLPGEPLAGQPITGRHLDALAATLTYLHTCVPSDALTHLKLHPWLAEGAASQLRTRTAGIRRHPDSEPIVLAAFSAAAQWLDRVAEPAEPLTAVFGHGDSYVGNFLWDGSRLRLVDFEDSGRSDRAFELACLTEHIGMRLEAGIGADAILGRFDLTAAASARVLFFRRMFAIFWLCLVHNRPGPVGAQAERVLSLLG
jgi:aminoglycoside phosphotransferase (APT) family kinase protein